MKMKGRMKGMKAPIQKRPPSRSISADESLVGGMTNPKVAPGSRSGRKVKAPRGLTASAPASLGSY